MKIKSILLLLLAFLALGYTLTHIVVNKKINNWVNQNENLSVKSTKLNLLFGNLTLNDIAFDDERYTTDTCIIKSAKIKSFSILDYLRKNEINIGKVAITNAQLFIHELPTKDSLSQTKRYFHIAKIITENVDLNYSEQNYNLQGRQGNVRLTDLTNANKIKFADIALSFEDVSYKPKNGFHNLLTDKIELSSIDKVFTADNFLVQPRCGEDKWPSCFPNKKGRSSYSVESIVGKLDTNALFNGLFLKDLEINNGVIKVLSFKNIEAVKRPKAFFMEKFDRLNIPINIPAIKVKNHAVEVLLKGEKIDTVTFDEIYASINNVSNMPDVLQQNQSVNVATISKFMDTDLKVDFDFKIKDPLNTYTFQLELQPMAFTKLNKAINYHTPMAIESGQLQQLVCEVSGNAQTSQGQCDIAYKNLYINIERKDGTTKNLITKVFNFIVKDGTNKNTNSMETKTYSTTLERDENKGYFHHAHIVILQIIKDAVMPL